MATQKKQECKSKRQALAQIRRMKWDDGDKIQFRNFNQELFYNEVSSNDITFCAGPAGCGKTYVATTLHWRS